MSFNLWYEYTESQSLKSPFERRLPFALIFIVLTSVKKAMTLEMFLFESFDLDEVGEIAQE